MLKTIISAHTDTNLRSEMDLCSYLSVSYILSLCGISALKAPDRGKIPLNSSISDEESLNWYKIAKAPQDKQQGIFCNILQAEVKKCKLTSCRYYVSCHSTA